MRHLMTREEGAEEGKRDRKKPTAKYFHLCLGVLSEYTILQSQTKLEHMISHVSNTLV